MNCIQNHLNELKLDLKHEGWSFTQSFLAAFSVFWLFNRYHNDIIFGGLLDTMLRNPELTFALAITLTWLIYYRKNLRKQIPKIIGFYIVIMAFMSLNVESSFSEVLYDEIGYPAKSVLFHFYNMPPIDPFQIVLLFSLSVFKGIIHKECVLLCRFIVRQVQFRS